MKTAAARRTPVPLYVLTALVCLALSAPLALTGVPAHAAPHADQDLKLKKDITLVIKSNDTYSLKEKTVDSSTGVKIITEKACSAEALKDISDYYKNAKYTFKDEGNARSCTIEGSGKISESNGVITHENDEYIVDLTSGLTSDKSGDASSGVDLNYSITFPGKVTDADGGKVDGNKVTFTDSVHHKVKGRDSSASTWIWILIGVLAVAVIGGVVAAIVITQRKKKNQLQPSPYAAPAQGYDPNQAFPAQPGYGMPQAQPGQQPYSAPQAQPGYGMPQDQPGQQPYSAPQAQPGYGMPQDQPGQQPYSAPQAQPGYGTPQTQTPPTQSLQPPYGGPQSGQSAY
ncbi:LppM family (lipo)protein [uncultured Actinomyces sp.]|uniref:LppM family (lipo)protein n=1 Tax=uncultured Actinomyces sp. TaxID=249061 RepID=UPI0028D47196|nr:hypothetical protein [uncultured Actinomyces sp.]